MIWRDVYLQSDIPSGELRQHLATAFGRQLKGVEVVPDEARMPEAGTKELVAVTHVCDGDYQCMLSIYLFEDVGRVELIDERSTLKALSSQLGCDVLLPTEGPNPFRFTHFSLSGPPQGVDVEFGENDSVKVVNTTGG